MTQLIDWPHHQKRLTKTLFFFLLHLSRLFSFNERRIQLESCDVESNDSCCCCCCCSMSSKKNTRRWTSSSRRLYTSADKIGKNKSRCSAPARLIVNLFYSRYVVVVLDDDANAAKSVNIRRQPAIEWNRFTFQWNFSHLATNSSPTPVALTFFIEEL